MAQLGSLLLARLGVGSKHPGTLALATHESEGFTASLHHA